MSLNKILIVLANSKKSSMGLGDYIRIACFLPNLKYKKIYWYSDKNLFPILKNIDFINGVYNLREANIKTPVKKQLNTLYKMEKMIKIIFLLTICLKK